MKVNGEYRLKSNGITVVSDDAELRNRDVSRRETGTGSSNPSDARRQCSHSTDRPQLKRHDDDLKE